MTEDRRPAIIISRPARYALLAVGVFIGLGIFAWSRQMWPFEKRKGSPEVTAVLDGGYKQQYAFHAALNHVQASPVVVAALGEPVAEKGVQSYQLILQSAGKRHDYVIDLKGPIGEGVATVYVEELAGRYRIVRASFVDAAGNSQDIPAAN